MLAVASCNLLAALLEPSQSPVVPAVAPVVHASMQTRSAPGAADSEQAAGCFFIQFVTRPCVSKQAGRSLPMALRRLELVESELRLLRNC